MDNRKHYAAAITAFVVWGFFALPLRALRDFTAGEILYFRILCSFLILVVIFLGFRRKQLGQDIFTLRALTPQKQAISLAIILGGGALLIVNWLVFIYVINAVNIKTASFSYLICPVITAVLGNFILKEKLTTLQWSAVALCVLSCVLLAYNSVAELTYSFAVAMTYALYLISQRRLHHFDRLSILFVQITFALTILSIFFSLLVNEVPGTFHFYGLIVIVAGIFTVLPLFLCA